MEYDTIDLSPCPGVYINHLTIQHNVSSAHLHTFKVISAHFIPSSKEGRVSCLLQQIDAVLGCGGGETYRVCMACVPYFVSKGN